MPTGRPKVSVIVPTYYRNERLQQAIDSVFDTGYEPLEIIVVDDSGEEHARPAVEPYDRVQYVPMEVNRGQNAALNRGLSEISGSYVQFLDDDDQVLSEKFDKQVSLLESEPGVGVAYCGLETDDGEVRLPGENKRGEVLEMALTFSLSPCLTSGMLFDAEILQQVTPLPEPPGSTDIYMMVELAQRTQFDFVNEPLIRKRESDDSVGSSAAAIEGNREVFDFYADVYDRVDDKVREHALGNFYNRAGRFYVSESPWSARAIVAFGKAVYHKPGLSVPFLGRFVGSLFGRPGARAVERGMEAVSAARSD